MRISIAQINSTVGDIDGNVDALIGAVHTAAAAGADVLVTAELALIGYPPRDLLLRGGVIGDCAAGLQRLIDAAAAADPDLRLIVGVPRRTDDGVRPLRNSVAVCRGGTVEAWYDKRLLPGYDVFDEDRYFQPGSELGVVSIGDRRIGLLVCEDLWRAGDVSAECRYEEDPVTQTIKAGADLIVALNASPFVLGKYERHVASLSALARRHGVPIVAVNQVGGNDALVFDGRSLVLDAGGAVVARLPAFEAAVETVELDRAAPLEREPIEPMAELFTALSLGVRDYVHKTGHERALLGISGGIDSALTAVIAVQALGPGNVTGVFMPTRYSSPISREDAAELASNLGLGGYRELSIDDSYAATRDLLADVGTSVVDVTDENIQPRLRGLLLMAMSNAGFGLLLAASNKSELATGYSTLYGDMCGAILVIGDILKTQVVELSRWINEHHAELGFDVAPIPERSITRPPSAELKPDQTDQDTLPPYDTLDEIVTRYVDREQSIAKIVEESGIDAELVRATARMIDIAQYKRFQGAVVLKVSPRTFGPGRDMPIVMRQTGASCRASAAQRTV